MLGLLLFLQGDGSGQVNNNALSQPSSPQTVASPEVEGDAVNWNVLAPILAAGITGLITFISTLLLTRDSQATELKLLKNQLDHATTQTKALKRERDKLTAEQASTAEVLADLKRIAEKSKKVKKELEASSVVRTYRQPVILVGPRHVGKTSLLTQWHSPWITSRLDRTQTHYYSDVPVYDFQQEKREPHFADPEILVPIHAHLVLRVHDFPGEPEAQKSVCQTIINETENLQRETGRNLGVVLICMFDAQEARKGISQVTHQYYNGELFRELRALVAHHQVDIERLILVFNKYDKLKETSPQLTDTELLRLCVDKFDPSYNLLHNVCNPDKVCEVFTMLSRGSEMHTKNRGAPIVLGEAARAFVRTLAGREAEKKVVERTATSYASEKFL